MALLARPILRDICLLVLILSTGGCSDSNGPIDCSEPLLVRVTPGTSPTVSWTPRCAASAVEVRYVEPGLGTYWRITTQDLGNRLLPPIAIGKPVPGTDVVGPRTPIVRGTFFDLSIGRTDTTGVIRTVGGVSFVP
jgi:hypothetical protein